MTLTETFWGVFTGTVLSQFCIWLWQKFIVVYLDKGHLKFRTTIRTVTNKQEAQE